MNEEINSENNIIEDNLNENNEMIEEDLKKTLENSIKVKEKEEKELFEKDLQTYKKLKNALKTTCMEIEKNLDNYYNKKSKNYQEEEEKINKNNFPNILKQYINKNKIIQKELDIAMKINDINELESLVIYKEKVVEKLKNENSALNNIKNNQSDIINKYNKEMNQREDIISLNSKISNLKEEIKLKKEFLQIYQLKIKKQRVKIEKIEKNCKLINENITYQKKKESEELEELYDEKRFLENKNVEELNKDYKNKQKTFNLEEKKFQHLIKKQQLIKSQLKSEIDLLYSEIIETEKNLKISEKEYNNSLIRKNQELKTILSYDNNNNQNTYNPFNVNNKLSTIPFNIKPCLNKNKLNLSLRINNNNNNRNSFQNILRNKSINDIYTNKNYEKI